MSWTALASHRTQPIRPLRARTRLCDELMAVSLSRSLLGDGIDTLRLGRYVVGDLIGRGAMGSVYRAYDPTLRRNVAVKVLRAERCLDAPSAQRLAREAAALARLEHPNVVSVYELGRHGDDLYIVMEWVDGVDLADWAKGPRRDEELVHILRQAAEGLDAAHRAGVIHQDIKPENILVGDDGQTRIADFGLCRVGSDDLSNGLEQLVAGTPRYMAPEQRAGAAATQRSDVFSFCVTAWEVLFGEHPWGGNAPVGEPVASTSSERVDARLLELLQRGIRLDPATRPGSLSEFVDALCSGALQRNRQ